MDSAEVKVIAERMAAKYELDQGYLPGRRTHVGTREGEGYRACAEDLLPRLLLMMKRVKHESTCAVERHWFEVEFDNQPEPPCTCGLAQEQEAIGKLIDP